MKKNIVTRRLLLVLTALLAAALFVLLASCALFGGNTGGTGGSPTDKGEKQFSVTLHAVDGFSVYDFIDKNTNVIKKPEKEPTKEGYDFVRWCSDAECTKELSYGTVINSDLEIYPHWKIKVFTVDLVNTIDESGNGALTVEYDETVSLPEKRAAGYTFLGWFVDRAATEAFDKTTKIRSDLTLYTGWSMDRYEINYETDGGILSENAPATYTMFAATPLPTCTKTGYRFVGWFDNADADKKTATPITEIAKGQQGGKTFYAKYNCELAGVQAKFDSVVVTESEIAFSAKYTQSVIDLGDYLRFDDGATYVVTKDGVETTIALPLNETDHNVVYTYDLVITSESGTVSNEFTVTVTQYTSANVTVRYYGNGVLLRTDEEHQRGDKAVKIDDPEPQPGYVFDHWAEGSAGGEEYDFNETLTDDLDLYACFEKIVYAVSYKTGYGKNAVANPATYTVTDAVAFADAVPLSDEYTFAGWYDAAYETEITGITLGSIGDKTVYARYALKNKSIKDYSGRDTIELDELTDFLTYVFYYRIGSIEVVVTGGEAGEQIGSYVSAASGAIKYVDGAESRSISYTAPQNADASGVWDSVSFSLTYQAPPSNSTATPEQTQVTPYGLIGSDGRADDFCDFAIEHIADGLYVDDSEQLVYAVEHGYRPMPKAGSVAEEIYGKAKTVLRSIVDDAMTDQDKALAIYEYVVKHTTYDSKVFDDVCNGVIKDEDAGNYCCFYLEGVFNDSIAVCDGYSKAFMLLCRIEGIRAVQVEGKAVGDGPGHAWNRVCLSTDGNAPKWYVVDCTSGDTISGSEEILTHAYFLITDADMATRYVVTEDEFNAYAANTAADYYIGRIFTFNETEYSRSIDSDEAMAAFLAYLVTYTPNDGQVSMDIHICLEDNQYDPFTYDDGHNINGIKNAILLRADGLLTGGKRLSSYDLARVSLKDVNVFVFLCAKKKG